MNSPIAPHSFAPGSATGRALLMGCLFGLLLTGALLPGRAAAQVSAGTCGSLKNAFGPYDYRRDHFRPPPGDNQRWEVMLNLVEIGHFTPVVEGLIRGTTTNRPGPDLDYTLRAIPNHHRALAAVLRLWERTKQPMPGGLPKSVECYFERAVRFAPNDHIARMLYVSYMIKNRRLDDATQHMTIVRNEAGENAFAHYNLGMLYADAGMYDDALTQAHRAQALGLGQKELEFRLKSAGRWKDAPVEEAAPVPAGAASQSESTSTSTSPAK